MDQIVDLDTNMTLDMYVSLSRDGTVALRCLRTSHLWQHFPLVIARPNVGEENDVAVYAGFSWNF